MRKSQGCNYLYLYLHQAEILQALSSCSVQKRQSGKHCEAQESNKTGKRRRDYTSRSRQVDYGLGRWQTDDLGSPDKGKADWGQPRQTRVKHRQPTCLEWLCWFCGCSRCSPNRQARGDGMREISSPVLKKDGFTKGWEDPPSSLTAWGAQGSLMAPWQHSRMHRIQHGSLQAALRDSSRLHVDEHHPERWKASSEDSLCFIPRPCARQKTST